MRKALALVLACGGLAAVATADPITPISFYAGYFSSLNFTDRYGNNTHFGGMELGAQESLLSLPIFGSAIIGASVVFGDSIGGGSTGKMYRAFADYKTAPFPGLNLYGIAGLGLTYTTGGSFADQTGVNTELGIGLPLKGIGPLGASIEARYRWGRESATGFSLGLNLKF